MTRAQLIMLLVVGVFQIVYHLARQHLERFGQLLQLLLAVAFLAVFWGWAGAVAGVGGLLILLFLVQGRIHYPCPVSIHEVPPELHPADERSPSAVLVFVAEHGWAAVVELEQTIPPIATIRTRVFSRDGRVFLRLQKTEAFGKVKWTVFFDSCLADERSITTTNSLTNFDVSWAARHPRYQVQQPSLVELLHYHEKKVRADTACAVTLDRRGYAELFRRREEERFEFAVKTGLWAKQGESYRLTLKGRLHALVNYFNFLTLLQRERIS